jgi:hypothetical protein
MYIVCFLIWVCVELLLLYTILIVADIFNMHCYNLLPGCPVLIASCMNVWTLALKGLVILETDLE